MRCRSAAACRSRTSGMRCSDDRRRPARCARGAARPHAGRGERDTALLQQPFPFPRGGERTTRAVRAATFDCRPGAPGRAGKRLLKRRGNAKQSPYFGTSKHSRADFLAVVKSEEDIGPPFAGQSTVRARLPFEFPPDTKQRRKQSFGFDGRPLTHTARGMEMLISTGGDSLCSSRSAMARRASTSAFDMASLAVLP
jgi:hypothetical protein